MTVKSIRGRRRYTAFEIPRGADRRGIEGAVNGLKTVKVINCQDGYAVIRTLPEDRDRLESIISTRYPGSQPFDCSGTLKALRERNPVRRGMKKKRGR